MSLSLYVHGISGHFPQASTLEEFWHLILSGQKSQTQKLSTYWHLDPSTYQDPTSDGMIAQDIAHLATFHPSEDSLPRQIQGAIDVGLSLKEKTKSKNVGLVLACEWTDASFYQAELGLIEKEKGFALERQLVTIKKALHLDGPGIAVDTACASSLYALELARGFLTLDSQEVIVLGLNLSLHSFLYRGFTKLGALSLKGELNSFDKDADGIVLGEAVCGVVVSLSSEGALAQIAAIGLSSDGNEGSAFSPGFHGQLHAYERAYRETSIKREDVDYIEAHGTATVLGDETECRSLHHFFKPSPQKLLPIGSLKANIGHTLAASGLASLIKAVLMIQHRTLPPHIRVMEREDLKSFALKILQKPQPHTKSEMVIGLSSFGFGGSNAHLVLTSSLIPMHKKRSAYEPSFYVQGYLGLNAEKISETPPLLKDVSMGPKMQERIDPLQRWAMHLSQQLVQGIHEERRKKITCLALNNLGGSLSLEFEKKYHQGLKHPELSIEAIASTLPSMMSGHPSILFNFQGHHLTLSGDGDSFRHTLQLLPFLLEHAEGELIVIVAHKNLHQPDRSYMLALRVSNKETPESLAKIHLKTGEGASELEDLGEARGAKEFYAFLEQKTSTLKLDSLELEQVLLSQAPSVLLQKLLDQSQQNKQIVLDYLNLLSFLKADHTHEARVGHFLVQCEKTSHSAKAYLVVDESQSYFFDHALDHIPGILSIHACEELLRWFMNSPYLIGAMTIRFTKFLEKNKEVSVQLEQRESGAIEFEISQAGVRAGIVKIDLKAQSSYTFTAPTTDQVFSLEDQKYTHKKKAENILVSSLDKLDQRAWALPLSLERGPFFFQLEAPSALYYAEVTRQFVMLLAHLVKDIPLSSKMNLIASEINLIQWVKPPFVLKLQSFKLTETDDFLVADVIVDFMLEERVFGQGKIKAQVVSQEYYSQQRGER